MARVCHGGRLLLFSPQAKERAVHRANDQAALRDRWNDQAAGMNAGGTPILTGGLKPVPIQMRSRDAQIAEVMKMTNEDIAAALGFSDAANFRHAFRRLTKAAPHDFRGISGRA